MNKLNNAFGQWKKNTGPSQKTHNSFMKRKPKRIAWKQDDSTLILIYIENRVV